MPRLSGMLFSEEGECHARFSFARDMGRFYRVEVDIEAHVSLICQRCMAPMVTPVEVHTVLGTIESAGMIDRLPESIDPLLVEDLEQVELVPIMEDELILALPQIAMHEAGVCQVKREYTDLHEAETEVVTEKENPFSVLADLKLKLK